MSDQAFDVSWVYASPLVAKTAAILDHAIEGEISRETQIALLIHNAVMPKVLGEAALEPVARQLVGFGIPAGASQILETDDHSITLVFASRLGQRHHAEIKLLFNVTRFLPARSDSRSLSLAIRYLIKHQAGA
jgi:hypothetical protein